MTSPSPPLDDWDLLREWMREATAEQLVPLLEEGRLPERVERLALRHAPSEALGPYVEEVLRYGCQAGEGQVNLSLALLCANPRLSAEAVGHIQERALRWMQEARVGSVQLGPYSEQHPGLMALEMLEESGYPTPPRFLEPLRSAFRRGGRGAQRQLACYAFFLLVRRYPLEESDFGRLYQVVKKVDRLVIRLLRHPGAPLSLMREVAKDFPRHMHILLALAEQGEARRDAEIRPLLLRSEVEPVLEALLPEASAEEFARLFREALGRSASFSVQLLESARAEQARGVSPREVSILLLDGDAEVRLRAGVAWGRIQEERRVGDDVPPARCREGEEVCSGLLARSVRVAGPPSPLLAPAFLC